jgi:erythromycin esterase
MIERPMTEHLDHAEGVDAQAVTRWIVDNAHPVATLDPRAPLADLEPLAPMVRDATVVGLGASTRGAHELSTLMHRVLRFLIEEVGFRSLAVEEDWTKGIQIDEYLRTGRGDPRALLADAWLPFRTEEILDVIRWMRSYNERHPADPVRFVGVDISSVRSLAHDAVADYVRRAAPDRLDELEAHYRALRPAAGIDAHTEWYRSQPDKQPFIDHARQAHDLVDGLPAGEGHALALHHARAIVSFYEYHSTDSLAYAELRLAANTIWWHEHTGDKVVYWGGSGHAANARTRTFSPPSTSEPEQNAGSYLRDHYGSRYVSIGLTFNHGAVPYPVPPPPAAFADAALGTAGLDTYLLDLHASQPPPVRAWLTSPAKVRLIGPRFDPDDNAAFHMTGGSLAEWFDIIIHRQATTSTHPLT